MINMFFNNTSIAVVGNGPISEQDRLIISLSNIIIRFNDVKNKKNEERTTIHVIRYPHFAYVDALFVWYLYPSNSSIDKISSPFPVKSVPVFEMQYDVDHVSENHKMFRDCSCGDSCYLNNTWAGASSGGIVLDILQGIPQIHEINVFGMNWNGDPSMHVDFRNKSIVSACCTKCVFHKTTTDNYGDNICALNIVFPLFVFIFILFGFRYLKTRYKCKENETPMQHHKTFCSSNL